MTPKVLPFDQVKRLSIKHAYKLVMTNYQKHVDENLLMLLAACYRECEHFHFGQYIDWRGRYYADSDYLTYQGDKRALAMIEYADPKKVTVQGYQSFKIYGANLYGLKGLPDSKVGFVEENKERIQLMDQAFLSGASDKPLFEA